jgi:small subunit ribosomal protein S20
MANTRSSAKRARQENKRSVRNTKNRSATRTAVKNLMDLVPSKDAAKVKDAYTSAIKSLSKAASKGVIPRTRAARKIARLTALIKKSLPDALPFVAGSAKAPKAKKSARA